MSKCDGSDKGKPEPKTIDLRASAHIKRLPDGSVVSIYTPPVVIELHDRIVLDNLYLTGRPNR